MAASDAKFIPIKNQAYRLTFDSYTIVSQVASPNTNGTGMDTKISDTSHRWSGLYGPYGRSWRKVQ